MKTKLASIISYTFHPLFMPFLGLLFFYFSDKLLLFSFNNGGVLNTSNWIIITLTFIFSLIIPISGVIYLKKTGKIDSYQMPSKEERLIPFAITLTSIFTVYYLLFEILNIEVDAIIKIFFWGCILSIMTALIITLFWKVSVHMIGIGGFTGAIFLISKLSGHVNIIELSMAIVIAGFVAYSRLSLKAHSPLQLVIGFSIGFTSEVFCLYFV